MKTRFGLIFLLVTCLNMVAADKYIHQLNDTTVSGTDLLVRDVESPPTVWKNYKLSLSDMYAYYTNLLGSVFTSLTKYHNLTNSLGTAAYSNATVFVSQTTFNTFTNGTIEVSPTNNTAGDLLGIGADEKAYWSKQLTNMHLTTSTATDPTATNSVVNKLYVDSLLAGNSEYYLITNVSDVSNYYYMTNQYVQGVLNALTVTGVTNNTYPWQWINYSNQPGVTVLRGGSYEVTFFANKGAAGTVTIKPEIYIRSAAGSEYYEIDTAQTTGPLTTTSTRYNLILTAPSNVVMSVTDRLVLKLKAINVTGTPDVTVSIQSNTVAHLSTPLLAAVPAESAFYVLRNDGVATNLTLYSGTTNRGNTVFPVGTVSTAGDVTNFVFSGTNAVNYVALADNMCITNISDLPADGNARFSTIYIDGGNNQRKLTFQVGLGSTNLIGDLYSTTPYLLTNKAVISIMMYGSAKTNIVIGIAKQ